MSKESSRKYRNSSDQHVDSLHGQRIKRGKLHIRSQRVRELRHRLNELLLEVEYDFIWNMEQRYINTLNERELIELVNTAEETLKK